MGEGQNIREKYLAEIQEPLSVQIVTDPGYGESGELVELIEFTVDKKWLAVILQINPGKSAIVDFPTNFEWQEEQCRPMSWVRMSEGHIRNVFWWPQSHSRIFEAETEEET